LTQTGGDFNLALSFQNKVSAGVVPMRDRSRVVWVFAVWVLLPGCGDSAAPEPSTASPGSPASASAPAGGGRKVHFIGFDASQPLVQALKAGKIEGLVVQNPLRMGELGVRTLVDHLEKKEVKKEIPTGETLVTPENLSDPEVARLVKPPQEENVSGASLSGAKTKKWKVMVIPKGTTHEFWKTIHYGAKKAADELGTVDLIWQGPQKEDDRVLQIQLVQTAVASGVDGIVLAPLDAKALVKPVEDAVARGIPVVIIDSGLESKSIVSYVATNNYNGGVLAARRLGELLKGEGKIILLRYAVGSASTEEREKGFTDTIAKEFPKVSYLSDTEYAGATSDTAQQKAQSLATKYRGQVDGIFCPNESSTFGMLRALEGAGMLAGKP
jgi:ribose transport system substrate-binding protein